MNGQARRLLKGIKTKDKMEQVEVKIVECVPYQKCPICEGKGLLLDWTGTSLLNRCKTCNGNGIIPMHVLPEEVKKHSRETTL